LVPECLMGGIVCRQRSGLPFQVEGLRTAPWGGFDFPP
jgi:hypothetical protein